MIDDTARQAIMEKFANMDSKEKSKLAESMVAPLRRSLSYQSIGRKLFPVDGLGEILPYGCIVIELEEDEAI